MLSLLLASALGAPPADAWSLAQRNADVLRVSTLFTASQVNQYLKEDAGVDRAAAFCKEHGITHVYLESFRSKVVPEKTVLAHARDRFRAAGFLVSGCVTTTHMGKKSTGWDTVSCYTVEETQRDLKAAFEYAAALFDEIMIDDFLFTDCQCPECVAARGARSWADYRCDLMLRLSHSHILDAARAVNPKARVIIKYPCWHENFQERGYDVVRQTRDFEMTWVGTETRGGVPESRWREEPQYRAYWLMRWLLGIGGEKCGGGWHDTLGTDPIHYLEQSRQTILGGAREEFLFNFGAIYDNALGKQDVAAWLEELPLHFDLARLIAGKAPRGILGWKPAGSPAGPDRNLQPLLGMAGFPVTAAHAFSADAAGFVFGHHVLHEATWPEAARRALASGWTVLVTPGFLEGAAAKEPALAAQLKERALLLPAPADANHYAALEAMPEAELNALRDRALAPAGISFHAPARVALYLFGDDLAVVESFRDEPARCSLSVKGWPACERALQMPAAAPMAVGRGATAEFTLPARTLVVLRRAG